MLGDIYVRAVALLSLKLPRLSLGASMTLVGLLPPLCDNGQMLVDGGYSEFLLMVT
jgi:hypothetical protein